MFKLKHPLVEKITALSEKVSDRIDFHTNSARILQEMARDSDFFDAVVRFNFNDENFINHSWSHYEIPYFWVADTKDFQIKFHVFVPMKKYVSGTACSCIHHHNNYLLSTHALTGSGYETMLFEPGSKVDSLTKEVKLRISDNFFHGPGKTTLIKSWVPHVVFNPEQLSATLTLWTPDAKRNTDHLRHNPILKPLKKPIRKFIYALGLEKNVGIAEDKTYQIYARDGKFFGIEEEEFFQPTKSKKGPDVDDEYARSLLYFFRQKNYSNRSYLESLLKNTMPDHWKINLEKFLEGVEIEHGYAKSRINIPSGNMTKQQILDASIAEVHV